jgi:hypothetical protein
MGYHRGSSNVLFFGDKARSKEPERRRRSASSATLGEDRKAPPNRGAGWAQHSWDTTRQGELVESTNPHILIDANFGGTPTLDERGTMPPTWILDSPDYRMDHQIAARIARTSTAGDNFKSYSPGLRAKATIKEERSLAASEKGKCRDSATAKTPSVGSRLERRICRVRT